MNKALRKSIETELISMITKTLIGRNKKAAEKSAKQIRSGSKEIAKRFVKSISKKDAVKPETKTKKEVVKTPPVKKSRMVAANKKRTPERK
jgi:hypothetical protein